MKNKLKLGLFGYGIVGQGLHDVLNSNNGLRAEIAKICVKDKSKKRRISMDYFTYDKNDLLNDPKINLIVELIDDADEAYSIVSTAMKNGKDVVTANKKMVAEHLQELVELQEETQTSFLYEASTCGSIPIIRNLEEYYDNELLYSVRGIFNGSSNFILSKMFNDGKEYTEVLKEAQELGFAETDPSLDVDGIDAKYKLVIITLHAYGLFIDPDSVFTFGISKISKYDINYAREKGFKIKLVPTVTKLNDTDIGMFVLPRFISSGKYLYNVDYEYNGVVAEAAFSDKQFFYGKGAGGHPTGSAVLSDISACTYDYRYEYKKKNQNSVRRYSTDMLVEIYLRYYQKYDIEDFKFQSVSEYYYGNNHNYLIGVINLKDLISIQKKLINRDIFIVNTGRKFD
jgi:homoserine dehydrogenase